MRHLRDVFVSALAAATTLVIAQTSIPPTGLPVGSCTPDIPCTNGACCNGNSGFCGFGPTFCTPITTPGGNCTSNCNAVAECGEYAAAVNRTCPLNVCCSQYGFCGTTADFCETGCQNNCNPTPPSGGGDDVSGGGAMHRRIGYYEGWASSPSSRACDLYLPEQISAEVLTHVNYAFALISTSYELMEMAPGDDLLWIRTTALKQRNSALKVFLSVGGWSFNDPPTSTIFSQLVASAENTNTFITSALTTVQAYGFDGIDIDWEYPGAYDRGGNPADTANYVTFMKAVKTAFGSNYGLSFTAPSSYWYLQHFNITGLLQWADFVNVMTYDLHGVWDGNDPWIGSIVLAHTNLTEIKVTLQLFENIKVDWSQVNIGFGFYGRSFELASEECNTPGCPFTGPADPGPCTNNAGTLSFAEIEAVISSNDLQPVLDEDAAVKYVVWDDRQWVSYDDEETFKLKMDYLNTIVGGSFIWSVDQDDTQYTALTSLYPDININNASSTQTNQCKFTSCGESCPSDWSLMTTISTPPTGPSCPSKHRASLCCPTAAVPQKCKWTGGGGTTCDGRCNVGQVTLALDRDGNTKWPTCVKGQQAYCCDSESSAPLDCYATSCGQKLSECPSGYSGLTYVKQGSLDNGGCEEENESAGVFTNIQTCPTVCSTNNKPVCCATESSYTNCHWVGTPPACTDAACVVGEVSVFQDIQGDASSTCAGKARRSYCCAPPTSEEFLPVPEDWVIPLGQGYGADQPASFTADFDDNTGPSDASGEGAGSTGIDDDGHENDSPFGEVFVTSPNSQSVSSVDAQSDWVLVGCDSKSDQPQVVVAYCSMDMDDDNAGCGHVLIGQAEHTIVRMPSSCGLGPYARVASLEVLGDQTFLSAEHQAALPANEKVYLLSFDYRFDVIPDTNGPIYMRADITDIPGYWDKIVDSAPDSSPNSRKRDLHRKRNFHQPIQYEKRWFGGFTEWLKRLNTITNSHSLSRNFHWSDTYTIYHAEESCPNFASSLDISVFGNAQINSQFGYYLEATVVPPAIQQAYIYVNAGASASATFTLTGLAKAEWSSEAYELISFGFPGLYYPGLLTLGPSLHLYGQLSGEISLYGQLSTSVGYTFPSINYAIGSTTDDPTLGSNLTRSTANNNGYNYDFGLNVELSGGLTAFLTPSLELGLTVLGGSVMDATAYVQAELYAGLALNGSVSNSQAPLICIQPQYGVNLHGGLKGAVVFWHDQWDHVFYQNSFDFGGACYNSLSDSSRREDLFYNASGAAATGHTLPMQHNSPRAFYSRWERKQDVSDDAQVVKHPDLPANLIDSQVISDGSPELDKRDTIPYLPGSLFCPAETSELDQTTPYSGECICYSDASMDPTNELIDVLARSYLIPDDRNVAFANSSTFARRTFASGTQAHAPILVEQAPMRTCPDINVRIPDYSKTKVIAYYDHDNPGTLDPTVGPYTQLPLNLGGKLVTQNGQPIYAREHVYEQSLSSLFIDYLSGAPNLWQTQAGLANATYGIDFCTWVQQNLVATPAYTVTGASLFTQLGNCYPSTVNGVSTTGLTGITNSMAILEQTMNEIKNTLFYDGERQLLTSLPAVDIRSPTTWKGYCPQKQVAVLRAAAGVPSFLNQWAVRQEFLKANTCVRGAWQLWYSAYLASTTVDAPNRSQVNVPNLYDNWIASIVKNIKPFLTSQLTTLVQTYNDTVNGQSGGSPLVDLSFYVLMDNNQVLSKQGSPLNTPAAVYTIGQPVSKQDLTNSILNNIPDVMLVSQLPSH